MCTEIIIPNRDIINVFIDNKDFEQSLDVSKLNHEIFLLDENLFYFYVNDFNFKEISNFLNKRIFIYLHGADLKLKLIGELQKMTKSEKSFFFSKKREEIPGSLGLGEFLVFIPEQYFSYS